MPSAAQTLARRHAVTGPENPEPTGLSGPPTTVGDMTNRSPRRLSTAQARRIALAAQGFAKARPESVTTRHLTATAARLQVVQIDSVNVLTRSHYLPFFSRLGPYAQRDLDALRDRAPRRLVEYWAHEASLVTPQVWPLLRHRMARAHEDAWGGMRRVAAEHPDLVERVHAHVTTHPPATAREIEVALEHDEQLNNDHWGWNWSLVKAALEHLFWAGRITSAGRTPQFERRYASLERVLPNQIADAALAEEFFSPTSLIDAPAGSDVAYFDDVVELVRRSAMAHGVGTELCLRDYFRLKGAQVRPAIEHLVSAGELEPVDVECFDKPAWRHVDAKNPRRIETAALLSPFDSLIWQRERTEALWNFRYRLEIYTPAAKRRYGYYVLPFLFGERLVARVDLKADRAVGVLRAHAIHWEPGAPAAHPGAADALSDELTTMATWLGLEGWRAA
ncbi:winged helix DNA-binding domain-containing protein [Dermacoccus nishinomiyaensis]|nr:winged helix DNA-binding domain-containing protein [Dermacoccus nishinomiyaensis]